MRFHGCLYEVERNSRTAGLFEEGKNSVQGRLTMNAKLLTAALLAFCFVALWAQEPPSQLDLSTTAKLPAWNDPKWGDPLSQRLPPISLGKSDFTVSGPLVDALRPPMRYSRDRSLRQKLLSVPIVNIFVPAPMPKTSREGRYFAWGERDAPWASVAERASSGPQGVLISVSR
jgi:hypothetical protein